MLASSVFIIYYGRGATFLRRIITVKQFVKITFFCEYDL